MIDCNPFREVRTIVPAEGTSRIIRFGSFELDVQTGELRKSGIRMRLPDQSAQVLAMLLERPGEVVTREELYARLWPNGTIVEFDHGINATVRRLRAALDDSAEEPRYIETLPKRGYRFVFPVEGPPSGDPPYRVLEQIGAGAMGTVYKAMDTRLGRAVALKFPPEIHGAEQAAALEREARSASALNHPNICTVYGVGELDGRPYIAMEYLEGQSLEAILRVTSLAAQEVVRIGIEVARALEAAHRHGIIHRDVKPANIFLCQGGAVKVLDFGIAALAKAAADSSGTAAYMSPEQIAGSPADARSDVYSLGIVLYEAIARRKPFAGETAAELKAAILNEAPAPLVAASRLEPLIMRCLEKDPAKRPQSAGAVEAELVSAQQAFERRRPSITRREAMAWGAAALGLAAAGAAGLRSGRTRRAETARFALAPPGLLSFQAAEISPDGRSIAICGYADQHRGLWVRRLEDASFRFVDSSPSASTFPFWSPDSRSLGVFAGGALYRVDVDSGMSQKVCSLRNTGATHGHWGESGSLLFIATAENRTMIMRTGVTGGEPTPFFGQNGELQYLLGDFDLLPGEKHVVYGHAAGLMIAAVDGTWRRALLEGSNLMDPAFLRSGYLAYRKGGALYVHPFDAAALQFTGDARLSEASLEHFSVSRSGTLLFQRTDRGKRQLAWYDRAGKGLGEIDAPIDAVQIVLSHDDRYLAMARKIEEFGVWVLDLTNGVVTLIAREAIDPVWSPDDRQLAYVGVRNGRWLLLRNAIGSGREVRFNKEAGPCPPACFPEDWYADGVVAIPIDGPSCSRVTPSAAAEVLTTFEGSADEFKVSPDGRWIAYSADVTGPWEIYVARFPTFADRRQVSNAGGVQPQWRRDQSELFYATVDGQIVVAPVSCGDDVCKTGAPRTLFKAPAVFTATQDEYCVTSDGQRFIIAEGVAGREPITVVLNWVQSLGRAG